MTQILVLRLRENSQPQDGFNYIAQQILQMQMRIRGAVKNIQTPSPGSPPEKVLAINLRKEVEEQLKPLSQRLWVKSIFDPPAVRFGSSTRTAIKDLKLRFHLIAVIYVVVIILNTFLLTGPTVAISYGALTYVFFFISNQLRKGVSRRLGLHVAKTNVIFVVSVGFIVNLGSTYVLDLLGLSHSYSAAILIAPTLSVLIIAASFIELALADRQTLIEILTRETRTQDHEYLDRASRGKAASYIHNSLQSELTSLVIQLDSVAANPDPIRSKIIMEKVESFISRSRSEDFKNYLETPELRLNRVAQSWEGIAAIKIAIDKKVYVDQVRASLMVQLIEESVANAVRSGRATKVDISAEFSLDSLKITVRDNGKVPIRNIKKGFGSNWIDSIAISHWALEETDSGRTLTVEI
jgi:signal transduction histidine kinase